MTMWLTSCSLNLSVHPETLDMTLSRVNFFSLVGGSTTAVLWTNTGRQSRVSSTTQLPDVKPVRLGFKLVPGSSWSVGAVFSVTSFLPIGGRAAVNAFPGRTTALPNKWHGKWITTAVCYAAEVSPAKRLCFPRRLRDLDPGVGGKTVVGIKKTGGTVFQFQTHNSISCTATTAQRRRINRKSPCVTPVRRR